MTKTPNAVINGKTGCIECLACGAEETLKLPANVLSVIDQCKAFGKAHAKCRKREPLRRGDGNGKAWRPAEAR